MADEINTSFFSHFLSLRLAIGKRLFGVVGRSGSRISPHRIVKGPCEVAELAALKYVAKHTSIPVPKVLNVYQWNGLYLELGYIPGMDLQEAWLGGFLSKDQKRDIISEVMGFISQLRKLQCPREDMVGSASLEACLDHRIGPSPCGPFSDHAEFHSFLRRNMDLETSAKVLSPEVVDCHSRRQYQSRFAHADLRPRNIIVDVDKGKVTGIIDWEFGGWYPEYWEYTKAHFRQTELPDWYEGLDLAMERYDGELEAERVLWKQCDKPGVPL